MLFIGKKVLLVQINEQKIRKGREGNELFYSTELGFAEFNCYRNEMLTNNYDENELRR